MKVSVYIATSADGYIAGTGGEIDWLHNPAYTIAGEDFGYADFMNTVDVIVMGRGTYEKVLEFGEWPYPNRRVVVLSRSLKELRAGIPAQLSRESAAIITERLQSEGARRVYIDGGKTICAFLQAKLVTDMVLTRIPLLLGSGIPLFSGGYESIGLKHEMTRTWPNGFVQTQYELP